MKFIHFKMNYHEIFLAIWLSVLLEELSLYPLLADRALETGLVVNLAKGSAAILINGLVARTAGT